MNNFFDLVVAADQKVSQREAQRNNSGRLAYSTHRIESIGDGAFRLPDPVMFEVTFVEEPLFLNGATLKVLPEGMETDPIGTAGVWQWYRTPKGHYTGAYVYLHVQRNEVLYDGKGETMVHNLLFLGMAIKDLGQSATLDAQTLAPRRTGFTDG